MKSLFIFSLSLLFSSFSIAQDSIKSIVPATKEIKQTIVAPTVNVRTKLVNTLNLSTSTDTFLYYLPMQQHKQGETPKTDSFVFKDLFALLQDKRATKRVEGLTILAAAKEMPPLGAVMGELIKASQSTSVAVREAAIITAGEYLDDLDILPLFESILKTGRPDDKVECLQALFNMDWCDEVELMVASALWDENEEVREIAISVINNSISKDGYDTVEDAKNAYAKKLKKK